MKKVVAGVGFEITGAMMLTVSAIIAALNVETTTEWYTDTGRYWQTVSDLRLFPVMAVGVLLLAAGIGFSLWGVFEKTDR